MTEKFDYELFCLIAEKNQREAEKKQKALRSLTDAQLDALIDKRLEALTEEHSKI